MTARSGQHLHSDGKQADCTAIREALGIILDPSSVAELRAVGSQWGTVSGYFNDHSLVAAAATSLSGKAPGVYVTLNPVRPDLLSRAVNRVNRYIKNATSDADILVRRWLLVDFDSVRPAGISATDAEHEAALDRAQQCKDWLQTQGWPAPVLADSGNGGHLLYRLELANEPANTELVKRCLQALGLLFSDERVVVDLSTYNAARIGKVYGTLAAKGDTTAERPHRLSRILSQPTTLEIVTQQQLSALTIPEATVQSPDRNGKALDVVEWLALRGIDIARQKPWQGGTCYTLRACPNNREHNRGEAYVVQFANGAIAAGCMHATCDFNWKSLRESYEPEILRARNTVGDPREKQLTKGPGSPTDWRTLLICRLSKDGDRQPMPLLANAITAFRHAPEWRGVLGFNEFSIQVVTRGPSPWGKHVGSSWTDVDDSLATEWLQREVGVFVSSNTVAEAVQTVARENGFHPVRNYLKNLQWDKVSRVDSWLVDYMGCADNKFVRSAGRCWLISAVARVFRPGCQADYVLQAEGPQGIRKSSGFRALAGDEWFSDHISDLGSKDARMELRGKWIVEMSELASMRRTEIERAKAFLTCRVDHYRPSYGRRAVDIPRQNVFAASTNDEQPFVDSTGNRRFWPVRCGQIDVAGIERDRDQIWAEAYHLYQQGEPWWLGTEELNQLAEQEQEKRYEEGVWDNIILDWLENPRVREDLSHGITIPVSPWDGSERGKVTINDVLIHAIGKDKDRLTQADYKAVARCLTHNGWKVKQEWSRGANRGKRYYMRPER